MVQRRANHALCLRPCTFGPRETPLPNSVACGNPEMTGGALMGSSPAFFDTSESVSMPRVRLTPVALECGGFSCSRQR
jgi:hypothetical protein